MTFDAVSTPIFEFFPDQSFGCRGLQAQRVTAEIGHVMATPLRKGEELAIRSQCILSIMLRCLVGPCGVMKRHFVSVTLRVVAGL
jgi:hypothetical protein